MDIYDEILTGKYDKDLNHLVDTINSRRAMLVTKKLLTLDVGSKVRFNANVRPKYLYGQTATVVQKMRKNVRIQLDKPMRRFGTSPITCPTSLIDPV